LYPLIWKVTHIEPYPTTHIIKQKILVYAECNSNTEFEDKFAPELVGKNTMAPLPTMLLNKVGVFVPPLYCSSASTRNSIAANVCIHKP